MVSAPAGAGAGAHAAPRPVFDVQQYCATRGGFDAGAAGAQDPVLFASHGHLRIAALNRPKALNAVDARMLQLLRRRYADWNADSAAAPVCVMVGVGGKAFCAGGDVVAIAKSAPGPESPRATFFYDEYQVDLLLAQLRTPNVALLDGITMGGGVGLSVHGPFRIVTENSLFAMPETAIGFFPDVGGGHFLSRLPGRLGLFLGLTGHRLRAADMLYCGIATHFVSATRVPELLDALAKLGDRSRDGVKKTLDAFHSDPGAAPLSKHRQLIDSVFSASTVADIFRGLEQHASGPEHAAVASWLKALRSASPTSLAVTMEQLERGAGLDLAGVLRMEYALSQSFMAHGDFDEGVRALLIDKDNSPKWKPAPSRDEVLRMFTAGAGVRAWSP